MAAPDGPETRREAIERDGFFIVRNLLSPAEIARLRGELREHFAHHRHFEGLGKHQPNAAIEVPAAGWIFAHPGIVAVFRELTECANPVFTTNCDMHSNMLSWWHKDTSENAGGCFKGDYFGKPSVGVYRAGIYLQDHDGDGRGLRVRPGSHHTRSIDEGAPQVLSTRAGDVIFFDMRLTHAGQLADPVEYLLLRLDTHFRLARMGYRLKEGWRRLLRRPDKMSIFFTYGGAGQDTADFCKFEAEDKRRRGRPEAQKVSRELVRDLAAQQVVCNPWVVPD
jgi:hypothetical protein